MNSSPASKPPAREHYETAIMSLAHFDSSEFGEVPLHWGPFIQLMMDEISDVLTPDQQAAFRFTDINEKYGRLSVSWQLPAELDSTTESQIELRISQAEHNIDQLDAQQSSRQPRVPTATNLAAESLAKQHDYPSRLVRRHFDEIVAIITAHKGTNPRVFGSVARGEDTRDSHLDLLFDPGAGMTLFDIGGMSSCLKELLKIEVDVVTPDGLREPMRTRVLAEAIPLCEFQIVSSEGDDA